MATTSKKADETAVETATATPEAEPAESATEPVETADTLSADIQLGLLKVVRNAVDPGTDHGVDIALAVQAADVYRKLFGENR